MYLAYLFATLESEFLHWLTLVVLPITITIAFAPSGRRHFRGAVASCGLMRGNLKRGLLWAVLIGVAISAIQLLFSSRAEELREVIMSGRAFVLFPMAFLLMMLTAAFTEEFFFRGFLQTRLEKLVRSKWLAVIVTSLLFGVYHLPYAYLNPFWPSAGDWNAAWVAALGNGVPGGLVLGVLFVVSRRNVLACMVLHAIINAFPAMTMIRYSSG